MTSADELAYATATDVAGRIRRRELSPVEAVEAAIERIEARNPSLNAVVFKGYDDARARAKQAEAALMQGGELGLLHGVPTLMKDLFDFKPGFTSTFGGIRAFKDLVIDAYCGWAWRVEQAGGIIVGKTNSPVMGFRGIADNPLFGPTSTPFDLARNSGGSSGGSAAAVADGMVTFAEGTDGGGSIRIPASFCGVYGYKPAFGRVPFLVRPNGFGSTDPFLYEGPITRTVEDAALVTTAISGHDPRDPFTVDEQPDFTADVRRSIRGMRIAYSPDLGVYPVDPRVAAVVADAVQAFREAGAIVEEVELEIPYDQKQLSDLWCRMIMAINVAGLASFQAMGVDLMNDHEGDLPPLYKMWAERCWNDTTRDRIRDMEMRTGVLDAVNRVFETHDLLVSPTLACLPPLNATNGDTIGPTEINGVEVDPLIGWCMTYFFNYMANPAASIPAGFADGLPVGMQIVGRRWADGDVFAASAAFERLRPWAASYERCRARAI